MGQFSFGIQIRINSNVRKHIIRCVFTFTHEPIARSMWSVKKNIERVKRERVYNSLTTAEINLARQNWFDIASQRIKKMKNNTGFYSFSFWWYTVSCRWYIEKFAEVLTRLNFFFFPSLFRKKNLWHIRNYIFSYQKIYPFSMNFGFSFIRAFVRQNHSLGNRNVVYITSNEQTRNSWMN